MLLTKLSEIMQSICQDYLALLERTPRAKFTTQLHITHRVAADFWLLGHNGTGVLPQENYVTAALCCCSHFPQMATNCSFSPGCTS